MGGSYFETLSKTRIALSTGIDDYQYTIIITYLYSLPLPRPKAGFFMPITKSPAKVAGLQVLFCQASRLDYPDSLRR